MLNEKLDSLVRALSEEADAQLVPVGSQSPEQESESRSLDAPSVPRPFRSKEQLMLRANSLKKALRQIIEQAEKGQYSAHANADLNYLCMMRILIYLSLFTQP